MWRVRRGHAGGPRRCGGRPRRPGGSGPRRARRAGARRARSRRRVERRGSRAAGRSRSARTRPRSRGRRRAARCSGRRRAPPRGCVAPSSSKAPSGSSTPSPHGSCSATAARAYAAKTVPDGVRVLSSSTSSSPSSPRTRSRPVTNASGWISTPEHPGLEVVGGLDHAPRHHPRGDDPPVSVGVRDERAERAGALAEPGGERLPLLGGDQARYRVEREPVAAEAHAVALQPRGDRVAELAQVAERGDQARVGGARAPIGREGLVVGVG